MKKILSLVSLSLLLLILFTACGSIKPANEIEINPLPAPERTEYVPDPLNVEFFNTTYYEMSNWIKYPNTTSTVTETPGTEDIPTEDSAT